MKLRIRNNSLRLRLSQSEVRALAAGESVSASTQFSPGNALAYEVVPGGTEIAAAFERGTIRIGVPAARLTSWASAEDIGIEGDQTWDAGSLHIVLEKDLACVTKRPEDDADAFPNPAAASGSCH